MQYLHLEEEDNIVKIFFNKNSVEEYGDIKFLDFNEQLEFKKDMNIIHLEAEKCTSSLSLPFDGKIKKYFDIDLETLNQNRENTPLLLVEKY